MKKTALRLMRHFWQTVYIAGSGALFLYVWKLPVLGGLTLFCGGFFLCYDLLSWYGLVNWGTAKEGE